VTGEAVPEPSRRPFRPLPSWAHRATRLVHGGHYPELNAGSVVPPIYQTSTFRYPSAYSESTGHGDSYIYTREENPTIEEAAEVVRELEGAEAARLFASGMGAISATALSLLSAGDEVVAPHGLYGGTLALLREVLPRFGVRVRLLNDLEAAEPEQVVTPATRLAILETPTNPVLRVHDLRRWAEAVHRHRGLLVVDNTFASPFNQRPLEHGADVVVESATKYLGGHADLIGGTLAGPKSIVGRIDPRHHLGAPIDPLVAFLLQRSLKTLELRVRRQNENAAAVLAGLEREPGVAGLRYPGRGDPAQEAIAARQMSGRGGMLAISLRGGHAAVPKFLSALRIAQVAASLGGVETLVSVPRETSHRGLSEAELAARGIDDGLVRVSLGIEDPDDLTRDLREAIAFSVGGPSPPL